MKTVHSDEATKLNMRTANTRDIQQQMNIRADTINKYILGKDCNRPFLLNDAFTTDATLETNVQTETIDFPKSLSGRDAIVDTLVRKFNQQYENIYTFCIAAEPHTDKEIFSCHWMVVMTAKEDKSLRIGCGQYDWVFESATDRASSLCITINMMETSPPSKTENVLNWASNLPYPWCSLTELTLQLPNEPLLLRVTNFIESKAS